MIKTAKVTGIIASILIIISVIIFYFFGENYVLATLALVSGLIGGMFLLIISVILDHMYKAITIAEYISAGAIITATVFLLFGVQSTARFYLIPICVIVIILVSITTLLRILTIKVYK